MCVVVCVETLLKTHALLSHDYMFKMVGPSFCHMCMRNYFVACSHICLLRLKECLCLLCAHGCLYVCCLSVAFVVRDESAF